MCLILLNLVFDLFGERLHFHCAAYFVVDCTKVDSWTYMTSEANWLDECKETYYLWFFNLFFRFFFFSFHFASLREFSWGTWILLQGFALLVSGINCAIKRKLTSFLVLCIKMCRFNVKMHCMFSLSLRHSLWEWTQKPVGKGHGARPSTFGLWLNTNWIHYLTM